MTSKALEMTTDILEMKDQIVEAILDGVIKVLYMPLQLDQRFNI